MAQPPAASALPGGGTPEVGRSVILWFVEMQDVKFLELFNHLAPADFMPHGSPALAGVISLSMAKWMPTLGHGRKSTS